MITKAEVLAYHADGRPGKIAVQATKPTATQRDLSIAYTPGVAEPCLEIARDPALAERYTTRANLVAVITNGTAVLGLGNIGALAGKPVMEGKAVLFKRFADIDVFDLEVATTDVEEFIAVVKQLEPTFGGINLEDIKAPECFAIEARLEAEMDIPVFHDDQHGTAIISGAAMLNACELAGKRPEDCTLVINGAGAAALSGAKLYEALGFSHERIFICDSRGLIYAGRENVNEHKARYAHPDDGRRTLAEVAQGADILMGLSVKGAFTEAIVASLAKDPVVFAMANPWPEIDPEVALRVRSDLILGTGRSDYANQVNNVLGFPFIFRGALDTNARFINTEMKVAAAHALAALAKQDVPESVSRAYGGERFRFGREYVIPKPFDPRVLAWEAYAVAKAAVDSGVARRALDLDAYREHLRQRLDPGRSVVALAAKKARDAQPVVVFPESDNATILRAVERLGDEEIAHVKLLGDPTRIRARAKELGLRLSQVKLVAPEAIDNLEEIVARFQRCPRGQALDAAAARAALLGDPLVLAVLLVAAGNADALVAGADTPYPDAARRLLSVMGTAPGVPRAAGMHLVRLGERTLLFADTTLNIAPDAEALAGIASAAADAARDLDIEPVVGMLSFANFGESSHPEAAKVARATALLCERHPHLPVIGEVQADWAVHPEAVRELLPEHARQIGRPANVLIFPNLAAANIAFRLLRALGEADVLGPVMLGLPHPVGLVPRGATVTEIVRLTALVTLERAPSQ